MAVAYKIEKAAYDALPDVLKDEYEEKDGVYVLELTGLDTKAQEKLDGERGKRRAAEKARGEAEAKLLEFQEGDDRPAMAAKHAKEIEKANKAKETAENNLKQYVTNTTLDKAAMEVATGLSKQHAAILLPHVKARMKVDATDPLNPKLVIVGSDGKDTDKKPDDLHKEFVANRDFAGIITGSQATGGTASRPGVTGQRGFPGGSGNQNSPKLMSDMTPAELVAHRASMAQNSGTQ